MSTHPLTALVVDDDIVPRRMMCFALQTVGFECACAVDGNDALARISTHAFDLVVTDLRMPGRHGHSLAVELLSRPQPPIIAVHTSLDDPRLAEDLMNRGVDDIVYKPTNYLSFAGKMKGLISHRRRLAREATAIQNVSAVAGAPSSSDEQPIRSNALRPACNNTPAWTGSPATAELAELLKHEESAEFDSIARVIHGDDALREAIISEANHVAVAIGRRKVVNVHEALSALGTRRIGEIASALSTLPS